MTIAETKRRCLLFNIVFSLCLPLRYAYKTRRKHRKLGLCLTALCCLAVLYDKLSWELQPSNVKHVCVLNSDDYNHKASSLDQSFWYEPEVRCDFWESLVNFDENGILCRNESNIKRSGHSNITCLYSTIHQYGRNEIRMSDYVHFESTAFIPSDFVHVICKTPNGDDIYSNLHHKVERSTVGQHRKLQNETEDQLSLIILGFDSVSNVVAKRMLSTHTIPFLRDELKAYFMEGYTKVGDNTLVNLAAALMGKSLSEFLVPTFDLPVLFNNILEKGYIDCYSEDWTPYIPPILGMNIPKYTHNLRTFFLAKENVKLYLKESTNIKKNRNSNTRPLCFGNRLIYKIVFEYTRQCIEAYSNTRKFVLMWQNEISHHKSNLFQLADIDIKMFFQWLKESGRLDKTIVVLMSDHGPRYGTVPKTVLGRFTSRFPFLSIVIPEQLKTRYPHLHRNMLKNTQRLTSHFDFHEMLKDIVNQKFEPQEPLTGSLPRGISLFREIPFYRSCYDASISEDNCGCYSFTNISTEEPSIKNAAHFIVNAINDNLKEYQGLCATLELFLVESATLQHVPYAMLTAESAIRYVLTVQTVPGHALFEATVEVRESTRIHILGEITRRNTYAGQTDCFENKHKPSLEPFCFCKAKNSDS